MGGGQARSLCPQAVVVEPRFSAYVKASRAVFEVFDRTTPVVEGLSIDEAFLDVGGMRLIAGSPADMATRLRREVLEQVGLPITVGVARTKFLAKVASGVAKPDGLLVVPADPAAERAFLHPLPIERLWGVGRVTGERLRARGIRTVGQVAGLSEAALVAMLGAGLGRHLHGLAVGRDPRRVQPGRRRGSMGAQRALGRGPRSPAELDTIVVGLVERVARRMRAAGRLGRTVMLRLRFDDFTRATRSHTLHRATAQTPAILATARELLGVSLPMISRQGVTLVGVAVANFDDEDTSQLPLPFESQRAAALDAALDEVRRRFGSTAITRAVLLGRDEGWTMPMLPD
jgi:DNA polymerase-4